jgi:hypothetical protein
MTAQFLHRPEACATDIMALNQSGLKKKISLHRVRLTHQEWRVRRALRELFTAD